MSAYRAGVATERLLVTREPVKQILLVYGINVSFSSKIYFGGYLPLVGIRPSYSHSDSPAQHSEHCVPCQVYNHDSGGRSVCRVETSRWCRQQDLTVSLPLILSRLAEADKNKHGDAFQPPGVLSLDTSFALFHPTCQPSCNPQ